MSTVVVFDYGSGNLHSVVKALESCGADVEVSASRFKAETCDGLVVPGVGAFSACMDQLQAVGGDDIIRQRVRENRSLLGICVGHQVLFSAGSEHGVECTGVGIYPGTVAKLPRRRLPHMGWNEVRPDPRSRFFTTTQRFYFVHSYGVWSESDVPEGACTMWTNHEGADVIAAVEVGAVLSTQFHPEKSGAAGLALLQSWVETLEGK